MAGDVFLRVVQEFSAVVVKLFRFHGLCEIKDQRSCFPFGDGVQRPDVRDFVGKFVSPDTRVPFNFVGDDSGEGGLLRNLSP